VNFQVGFRKVTRTAIEAVAELACGIGWVSIQIFQQEEFLSSVIG